MRVLLHVHPRSLCSPISQLTTKSWNFARLSRSPRLFDQKYSCTRTFYHTPAKFGQPDSQIATASSPTSPGPAVASNTWIDKTPAKLRPYLLLTRIDKPIGTLLLFYPCSCVCSPILHTARTLTRHYLLRGFLCYAAWSITMASYAAGAPFTTPLTYISLCGIGALIMRSAGCTINDMADKNFDKAVGEHRLPRMCALWMCELNQGCGCLL